MEPQLIDYYNEKSISMNIPETIKYKFGNGAIRFKKDGKYYHGVDPYTKPHNTWDPSEDWTGRIWHYTNQTVIAPNEGIWDTFDIKKFCCDCSYETNKNKNRRSRFVYQCNGHI